MGLLILQLSNLLIQMIKIVDPTIVKVEMLEYWQQLKIHKMLLKKYLSEMKTKLLK